jgi:hypothetical protein
LISTKGARSCLNCFGRFAKLELRKACAAGVMSASGNFSASAGALLCDSAGGMNSGTPGSPAAASVSE